MQLTGLFHSILFIQNWNINLIQNEQKCVPRKRQPKQKTKNNIVLIYIAFRCIAHQYRNKRRRKKRPMVRNKASSVELYRMHCYFSKHMQFSERIFIAITRILLRSETLFKFKSHIISDHDQINVLRFGKSQPDRYHQTSV